MTDRCSQLGCGNIAMHMMDVPYCRKIPLCDECMRTKLQLAVAIMANDWCEKNSEYVTEAQRVNTRIANGLG